MTNDSRGKNYKDEQQKRLQSLSAMAESIDPKKYERIFHMCSIICEDKLFKNDFYILGNSLGLLLENAKGEYLYQVINRFFKYNIKLSVFPKNVIYNLVNEVGSYEAELLISKPEFFNRSYWLYWLYVILSEKEANSNLLVKVHTYFKDIEGEVSGYTRDLEFLKKYLDIDSNVFIKVTQEILKQEDITVIRSLQSLFNPYSEVNKELFSLYQNDLNTLKQAYMRLIKIDDHFDYDFSFLKKFLIQDITILDLLLDYFLIDQNKYLLGKHYDFNTLWEIDIWEEVMYRLTERLEQGYQQNFYNVIILNEKIFHTHVNEGGIIQERKDYWIKQKLEAWSSDHEKVKFLFSCITNIRNANKVEYIKYLLCFNHSFELFSSLEFHPRVETISGSEVPFLERRKEFYEMISRSLNGLNLLEHKKYVQDIVDSYNQRIKRAKVEDFMDDI